MENFLLQCENLSVTARVAISLLVFEKFCEEKKIESALIGEFLDYLWKWPLINGADEFDPWQESRPELVDYGLNGEATPELLAVLASAGIEEYRFQKIIGGIVSMLWMNFWGGVDKNLTIEAFEISIKSSKITSFPPITPFKFSVFDGRGGWGERVTEADRNYWRTCFKVR